MELFVGLDVSQNETSVCVIDGAGRTCWQGRCASTPEAIAATLAARAPGAVRVGLETGPLSTWHWHALNGLGVPVVCLDARHAKAALSLKVNKSDANGALGLAQIVRMGWFREVRVKSMASHRTRAVLVARAQLVAARVDLGNQMRGVLKTFGHVVGPALGRAFERRVEELAGDDPTLRPLMASLLAVWRSLREQVEALDRQLLRLARGNTTARRLMTVPGVGAITALAFLSTVDDPGRFAKSKSVGAYLGLTPTRYQSGEVDLSGRISKRGDPLLRTYLFEAAGTLMMRVARWSALKAWGVRLAKRAGLKKAKVAVARKLAVVLHRIWADGSEFAWSTAEARP
jgi:transposase